MVCATTKTCGAFLSAAIPGVQGSVLEVRADAVDSSRILDPFRGLSL
jgi:hypothetical protein